MFPKYEADDPNSNLHRFVQCDFRFSALFKSHGSLKVLSKSRCLLDPTFKHCHPQEVYTLFLLGVPHPDNNRRP